MEVGNQEKLLIRQIEDSLLFDEEWYINTYGAELPEEMSPALHYLAYGWKLGYDPSEYFGTKEYLEDHPELEEANICPLLHWELMGLFMQAKIRVHNMEKLREKHPECVSNSYNMLRLRITHRCNSKCRYCGQLAWPEEEQRREMDPVWYYEYLRPVYQNLRMILVTGGEPLVAKESYNYMKFLSENYPQITVITESNGLAFSRRFQELAADNLFMLKVSLNASSPEVFEKSCYAGEHARTVYNKIMENIRDYIQLLRKNDLLCFAPSLSMVINKDNYDDVYSFVKLCLELRASKMIFFFDYTESNMFGDYFGEPETSRSALQTIMEIERVLDGSIGMGFRLWIPRKELVSMQKYVNEIKLEDLREKYSELLELAEGRSVRGEFEERNRIRRAHGKQELLFDEDTDSTLRMIERNGKKSVFHRGKCWIFIQTDGWIFAAGLPLH